MVNSGVYFEMIGFSVSPIGLCVFALKEILLQLLLQFLAEPGSSGKIRAQTETVRSPSLCYIGNVILPYCYSSL